MSLELGREGSASPGVSKSFGEINAVNGIDLIVGLGEALAFLGPNGASKSTTISLLLGLLRPSTGREGIPWSTLPTNAGGENRTR